MTGALPVIVHQDGAVGVITLATPEKFNALSTAAFVAIEGAFDQFESENSGIRVVLVRSEGANFCTGADLDEAKELRSDAEAMGGFIRHGHRVMSRLEGSVLPVVVACQGLALAGGGELMMACDVAIAASNFRFGDQHAQYGLIPGFGGSQRLPRIVGLRRALGLFYSASWIDAQTALAWGLVNQVVETDQLEEAALAYCVKLASRSRPGIAAMKRLARSGLDGPLHAGLSDEADAAIAGMLGSDVDEGLAAFLERRTPNFTA